MNRILLGMLASIILLVGLIFVLASSGPASRMTQNTDTNARSQNAILLYCAASNRPVIEAIRDMYESEFGHPVDIQYGPSQTLLSSMEVSHTGDLYLPADDSYLDLALEKGLVQETLPIAQMHLVIAVLKGNPKQIHSLEKLMDEDVIFVQANPEAAAVGKITKQILEQTGQWAGIDAATAGYRSTVTDVANDVTVGAADAAIVYDVVLQAYPSLEAVEIPEFARGTANVAVGVVTASENSHAALHFARYLAAKDRGQLLYQKYGFRPVGTDIWSNVPQISIFAGSMLQPAIEQSLIEFEQREGVEISRVYNGCGILVGQMKTGQQPDAYFACDTEFMQQVQDQFTEPVDVSQNELVIVVAKGNPHNIKSLKDLTRPGLRVGVGHEKQCAMGWLTQQTFAEGGIQKEIMENVTTQAATGDMLINQLKVGSLDAAVAYLSNAAGSAETLDAVRITGISCSQATQPFAISKETEFSQLTSRLMLKLQSEDSKKRFIENGFVWGASLK